MLYETVTLIRSRIDIAESIRFGQCLFHSKGIHSISIDHALEEKALEIFTTLTDKDYSFIDCAFFAVMHELGIKKAFTIDKHLQQFGFERVPKYLLIPRRLSSEAPVAGFAEVPCGTFPRGCRPCTPLNRS